VNNVELKNPHNDDGDSVSEPPVGGGGPSPVVEGGPRMMKIRIIMMR